MQTAFPLEEQLHVYPSNPYPKCWSCFHLHTTGGMGMHQRNKAKAGHDGICGNNLDKLPWISGTKAQCHHGKVMPLSPLFTSRKEAYSLSGFLLVWNYSSSLQMSKHRGGITLPSTTSASRSTIHTPSSPLLSSHAPASSHSRSFYHFTSHITWSSPPPSLWLLGLRLLLFEKFTINLCVESIENGPSQELLALSHEYNTSTTLQPLFSKCPNKTTLRMTEAGNIQGPLFPPASCPPSFLWLITLVWEKGKWKKL